jgi:hypothetical protein
MSRTIGEYYHLAETSEFMQQPEFLIIYVSYE